MDGMEAWSLLVYNVFGTIQTMTEISKCRLTTQHGSSMAKVWSDDDRDMSSGVLFGCHRRMRTFSGRESGGMGLLASVFAHHLLTNQPCTPPRWFGIGERVCQRPLESARAMSRRLSKDRQRCTYFGSIDGSSCSYPTVYPSGERSSSLREPSLIASIA
jgi:hypothetical protein